MSGTFYNHDRDHTLKKPHKIAVLKYLAKTRKHEDNAEGRRVDKKQTSFYNHALRATVQMAGSHNLTKALHAHDGEGCTQMVQAVPK